MRQNSSTTSNKRKRLAHIPAESRVAQNVRFVLEQYDQGIPYRQVREQLAKQNEDLGWFQAPVNIGFVVIVLMYGEGNFKRSLICAINCGRMNKK